MNTLTRYWTPEQEKQVGKALERLFALQDKPLPEGKKITLVEELQSCSYPVPKIIEGINSLVDDHLIQIKFSTILSAIQNVCGDKNRERPSCTFCYHGVVLMRAGKQTRAFGCICDSGDDSLRRWDGKDTQYYGDTLYTRECKFEEVAAGKCKTRVDCNNKGFCIFS
ncbi:MAG: hypothetical protein A2231_03105 [Candidatus Firestonebacteria bacterium RIFOXYA2_FULL_40_8]|nr:MAG: hypothetical protein A2231_03105 [Candidatus Firestonebacteria bacterium RIFOXYA2_FULL_40_8]